MPQNILSEYFKRNKRIVLFLSCVVFGVSLYANLTYFFKSPKQLTFFPPFIEGLNPNDNQHLGAEYFFIAQAITSGKGFSNPFQADTGPTAWMPPLYPFFLAFLIKLFHSKVLVTCAVLFFKNIALIFTGLLIYETAQRSLVKIKAEFIVLFYLVWLLINFRPFFQTTHDSWLLLLFIGSIFPLAVFMRANLINLKTALAWGVLGGLSTLASPIIGLVWGVLWTVMLSVKKNIPKLLLSFVVFFSLVLPWVIRNYVVFDKLILMKSNLYFDAYFVNYETKKDGLIDGPTFRDKHPVWTVKEDPDSPYKRLGEVKFLETYKKQLLSALSKNPYTYIRNVKNRLFEALFSPQEQLRAKILFCRTWFPHSYERFIFWRTIKDSIWLILHTLPFVGILLIILLKGYSESDYMKIALLMYGIYLIPYIAIIYYTRYSIPLTPFKVLFIFWGIDLLIARLSKIKPGF
jgi:hypothetical protein